MNFEEELELALEAVPDYLKGAYRRRLAYERDKQSAVDAPVSTLPPEKKEIRFPPGTWKKYSDAKNEIVASLGKITAILPELKDDVRKAYDYLWKNVTSALETMDEDIVGERWQILQHEWLNVLKNIEKMFDLVPVTGQYAELRNRIREFKNILKSSVGKVIFQKPSGEQPKSFAAQPPLNPYQRDA